MNRTISYWSPQLWGGHERMISRCGRECHRTEDRIKEDESSFLRRIVRTKQHTSIGEHVGLKFTWHASDVGRNEVLRLLALNPTIQWSVDDLSSLSSQHTTLTLNGRHLLEMQKNNTNGFWASILSASQEFFPVLIDPVTLPLSTKPILRIQDAHTQGDPDEMALATYHVRGFSRITETQWVRHRMMSYSVASGRVVDYSERAVVIPPEVEGVVVRESDPLIDESSGLVLQRLEDEVREVVEGSRHLYSNLQDRGIKKQDARFFLPQGLQTSMVVTAPLKWWNHFFSLRTTPHAMWEIRSYAKAIQKDLHTRFPYLINVPTDSLQDEVPVDSLVGC